MEREGLNQTQFARKIWYHNGTVNRWVRGFGEPDNTACNTICETFGVDLEWLCKQGNFASDLREYGESERGMLSLLLTHASNVIDDAIDGVEKLETTRDYNGRVCVPLADVRRVLERMKRW
jgi:transcriptional regulator with XRE-family HTH domain